MKYALIGCGRIAVNHIKAVVNNNLDMVAVCDIDLSHVDILFEKTGYNKPVERYTDYKKMLERFAVMGEELKINDDEFDYIYYTYGLEHYDNMPLIEPLEYKDERRVRDFAIVIDTSASCMGSTVRSFLRTTYDILKSTESFYVTPG